ncbi:hypothetical protein [Prosthecobacter sp.]|uniref:hypothetical protein n=1 Tax=Prosthecobacter sp. TaxID=1965333 RepID=UPI0037840654
MTSLLPKHDSRRQSLREYGLSRSCAPMEKPGVDPSALRLALILLATLSVITAALLSAAGM